MRPPSPARVASHEIDQSTHRRGVERRRTPGEGGGGFARRRLDGAVHRALPQGGDGVARRFATARSRRAAALPPRDGGAAQGDPRFHPRAGQARRGAGSEDQRRGHQGAAGGHLPSLQAQAPNQGADRARERAGAAGGRVAGGFVGRSKGAGRRLRQAGLGRDRGSRARRRARHSRRTLRRRRGTAWPPARGLLDPRQTRVEGARREGIGRREIRRLFRLLRTVRQASFPPRARDAARRTRGSARPAPRVGSQRGARIARARPLRTRHRPSLRRRRPRPPGRQMDDGNRALGVADEDRNTPRHRSAHALVDPGRGRGRARVRRESARPAARRARWRNW